MHGGGAPGVSLTPGGEHEGGKTGGGIGGGLE